MKATPSLVEQYYKTFNAAYFDNMLPNDIEFGVMRSKKTWGIAAYEFTRKAGHKMDIRPVSVKITSTIDMTEYSFKSTVLHEMIHILDYCMFPEHFESKRYDAHGDWFKKKAEEIHKKSGIDITVRVSDESIASSNTAQLKQQIADKGYLLCVSNVITSDKLFVFKTNDYYLNHGLIDNLKGVLTNVGKNSRGITEYKKVFSHIEIYECHSTLLADNRAVSGKTASIGGFWYEDIDKVKEKYGLSATPREEYNF